MKRYKQYKPTGISWLPEIPAHWDTMRIRGLFEESIEKTVDDSGTLLSLSQYTGVSLKSEAGKTGMFEAESTTGYKIVHPGQFVMNIMLAWNGSYAVSDLEGIISPAYCVFDFRIPCVKRYFDYLLRTKFYSGAFKTESRGIIDSRLRLYPNKFYSFKAIVPPIEEQEKIVAYLDKKITLIESCKCQRERELQTLNELKQAEIASVVTRGLNPNVPMKDSGIFWQPLIPDNWTVTKLKHVLSKLDRPRQPEDELLVCSNSGEVKKRGDSKLGLVADSDEIYQGVKRGDLLIHGMDTWHGAIAVSDYDGMCTPVVHVCDSTQNKKYIALYLRNMAYQKVFKLISNGVRQNTSDFRSWGKVGTILIPIPPIEEQDAIVEYIESKNSKIDKMIDALTAEIERLTEYKQRLISDVVTGQVDVRGEEIA